MSDTPRTDAACNIYDLQIVAEDIERELNSTNADVERLTKANLQLREGCEELKQRINRLEDENDALRADLLLWEQKEVKP